MGTPKNDEKNTDKNGAQSAGSGEAGSGSTSEQDASNASSGTGASAGAGSNTGASLTALEEERKINEKKFEELGARLTARDSEISRLNGVVAERETELAELKEKNSDIEARLRIAEEERDKFQARLAQKKVETVDLERGQAQLTESVMLADAAGAPLEPKVGDILLRDGKPEAVAKAQTKFGAKHRVYSVPAAKFDRLVADKLATVRD